MTTQSLPQAHAELSAKIEALPVIKRPISELLGSPDKWTKNAYARVKGEEAHWSNGDAECFCLFGAVQRCRLSWKDESRLRTTIKQLYPQHETSLTDFNDHPDTTFEDVQKVLHAAGL